MIFKGSELLHHGFGIPLGWPQPPRPLGCEEGEVQELVQGRSDSPFFLRIQGGGLAWSPSGPLRERLLVVIVIILRLF